MSWRVREWRWTPPESAILGRRDNALWADPEFVAAAESYLHKRRPEAEALFHFRGERDRNEVILRAPLLVEDILHLSGHGSFDAVCNLLGAASEDDQEAVAAALKAKGQEPQDARFVDEAATQRVTQAVVGKMRARIAEVTARGRPPETSA